jgi:hypothetical protein
MTTPIQSLIDEQRDYLARARYWWRVIYWTVRHCSIARGVWVADYETASERTLK